MSAGGLINKSVNGKLVYAYVIESYRCPSDRTPSTDLGGMGNPGNNDENHAISNYGANYLAFTSGSPMGAAAIRSGTSWLAATAR